MSKLLIQEPPLQVLPSLAVAIGLDEAIALQQLHYWLNNPKSEGRVDENGIKWVYNTYAEWKEKDFPFWSEDKIQRVFLDLEKIGLVISAKLDAHKRDMRKFYRIDYNALCALHGAVLPPSNAAKASHVKDELTETTTENNTSDNQISKPTARIDRTEQEQEELDRKKENWLFPANQAEVDENVFAKEAVDNFESCLHFNPLPWSSNREWERLEKFVVAEYCKDKNIWQRYDTWRKSDGKYAGALSNKAIKYRPDDFIACFPDFLAHTSMYGKKSGAEVQVDADGTPITF